MEFQGTKELRDEIDDLKECNRLSIITIKDLRAQNKTLKKELQECRDFNFIMRE